MVFNDCDITSGNIERLGNLSGILEQKSNSEIARSYDERLSRIAQQSKSGNYESVLEEFGKIGAGAVGFGENVSYKVVETFCKNGWEENDEKVYTILEAMPTSVLEELINFAAKRAIRSRVLSSLGLIDYSVPSPHYKEGDIIEKCQRIKEICENCPQVARSLFTYFKAYPLEFFLSEFKKVEDEEKANKKPKQMEKQINGTFTFTRLN